MKALSASVRGRSPTRLGLPFFQCRNVYSVNGLFRFHIECHLLPKNPIIPRDASDTLHQFLACFTQCMNDLELLAGRVLFCGIQVQLQRIRAARV